MKLNLIPFWDLERQKYINVQKHDTADLLIWNYGQKCQFERYWTPETSMARGLITDLDGEIIARPFKKFFNLGEHLGEDSKLPPLPIEKFKVTEKEDGSLGILYHLPDGTPQLATRGSFTSDQAIKGTEMLRQRLTVEPDFKFQEGFTWLWEIIYPQNRIVIDYAGKEDLILLAIIDNETGKSIDPNLFSQDLFPLVNSLDGIADLTKLKELQKDNKEGFVVHFTLSDIRVKIKFEEYIRLHRLVTGVNAKTIWDLLRNDQPFDELLEKVSDEYYDWVKKTKTTLEEQFKQIEDEAIYAFNQVKDLETRKEQALFLQEYSHYSGIVFKMLDKQPYNDLIWKMLRPVASKPFHQDIDA